MSLAINYTKRQRRGRPDPSKKHRDWVRKHVCVGGKHNNGAFCNPEKGIDCAHYRSAENSGMGQKPGDEWLVPFCRNCHRRQHDIGQKAFEKERGISMMVEARDLALTSPDPAVKMRALTSIANVEN
jgi:hypothetical protein